MNSDAMLLLILLVGGVGLPVALINGWWLARARQPVLQRLAISRQRYAGLLQLRLALNVTLTCAALAGAVALTGRADFWVQLAGLLVGGFVGFNVSELLLRLLDRHDALKGIVSDESRVQMALKEAAY